MPLELGAGVYTTVGKNVDDLAKIPPGSIVNPNYLSRGDKNITTIFGPKGTKVRNVEGVMSKAEYMEALKANPNFKFKKGGLRKYQTAGVKETSAQYNARIKAKYEANVQSYNDSTASYQNQVEMDNILTNLENAVTEYDAGFIAEKDTMSSAEYEESTNRYNEFADRSGKTLDDAFELHDENVKRGIYLSLIHISEPTRPY